LYGIQQSFNDCGNFDGYSKALLSKVPVWKRSSRICLAEEFELPDISRHLLGSSFPMPALIDFPLEPKLTDNLFSDR